MYSFLLIKNNGGYHFLLYSGSISYSGILKRQVHSATV